MYSLSFRQEVQHRQLQEDLTLIIYLDKNLLTEDSRLLSLIITAGQTRPSWNIREWIMSRRALSFSYKKFTIINSCDKLMTYM